jgi:hypothetical protein
MRRVECRVNFGVLGYAPPASPAPPSPRSGRRSGWGPVRQLARWTWASSLAFAQILRRGMIHREDATTQRSRAGQLGPGISLGRSLSSRLRVFAVQPSGASPPAGHGLHRLFPPAPAARSNFATQRRKDAEAAHLGATGSRSHASYFRVFASLRFNRIRRWAWGASLVLCPAPRVAVRVARPVLPAGWRAGSGSPWRW